MTTPNYFVLGTNINKVINTSGTVDVGGNSFNNFPNSTTPAYTTIKLDVPFPLGYTINGKDINTSCTAYYETYNSSPAGADTTISTVNYKPKHVSVYCWGGGGAGGGGGGHSAYDGGDGGDGAVGVHPGHQLDEGEGLGHVVVAPHGEAGHPVLHGVLGREEDHRDVLHQRIPALTPLPTTTRRVTADVVKSLTNPRYCLVNFGLRHGLRRGRTDRRGRPGERFRGR